MTDKIQNPAPYSSTSVLYEPFETCLPDLDFRSGRTVLVAGGAGYIGSHVCKALKKSGFIPVTYDNLCSGNREAVQWGPFIYGDIRDRKRLARIFEICRPCAVMHFAALIQVGQSVDDPAEFYNNNVYGSLCLMEEARLHNIQAVVFSSTAAVYGAAGSDPLHENLPLKPVNPYGQTKLSVENIIKDYEKAYGTQYAILRYFNAAGADPDTETGTAYKKDTHIIPLLMRVAAGMMPGIKIFGTDYNTPDGTAIRDYIHVTDLAEAHVRALGHILRKKGNLILNLGTNQGYSVRQVIDTARLVTGQDIPAENDVRREGDPPVLIADARQAQEVLNWKPHYSDLRCIIDTAWKWRQKQHPAAFVPSWIDPQYYMNDKAA